MQRRHTDRNLYFNELADTCKKYYLPFFNNLIGPDTSVLEIGCGHGGNLLPFAEKGCKVIGLDLAEERIQDAKEIFAEHNIQGDFFVADIFDVNHLGKFDIILIHDVIEHIPNKELFLKHIIQFIKPNGVIFIAFPAWQMPFGGHQQICSGKISKLPFIHLLPKNAYKSLLKIVGEQEGAIDELLRVKECRLTIERFRKLVKDDYVIDNEQFWFINPHYNAKFGLKPRHLTPLIGKIPWIRNFFTTSCFYFLKLKGN